MFEFIRGELIVMKAWPVHFKLLNFCEKTWNKIEGLRGELAQKI